jgi:hypothetical protein
VDKHCELYCKTCQVSVCSTCIATGKHKEHDISEILKRLSTETQSLIQKDLKELETSIYPQYEERVSDVQTEKAELTRNYERLTTAADQQGYVWHREITAIVEKKKSDIEEMKSKHAAVLDKQSDELTHRITELRQIIQGLKKLLDSNDVTLASTYKSRNGEFRQLPHNVRVTLPRFSWPTIDTEQLHQLFGSLSSVATEQDNAMTSPDSASSPAIKPLLDEPSITATIDTGYIPLSVSCLNDDKIWTCENNKIMKLLNLQGELLTSIQTDSGGKPGDIAVTRDGDVVYTDYKHSTVNIVKKKQKHTVVTLHGWGPLNVCCTSSDDLLVTMVSANRKQSKVVRYSGSTEKQTIQFDDEGHPLFSPSRYNTRYISENRNFDICVADREAKEVVVVNQSGKLRFRYTAHLSNIREPFSPRGITTDSQSHILIADINNGFIHILDQDGQFLRYIQNCDLRYPYGLCVDIRDNLFVSENTWPSPKVKKIKYL